MTRSNLRAPGVRSGQMEEPARPKASGSKAMSIIGRSGGPGLDRYAPHAARLRLLR